MIELGVAVPAARMVALAAAADVGERAGPPRRQIGLADLAQPGRDVGKRGLPADRLVRPVRTLPQRGGEPVVVVAVPGQPRFLAQVAGRGEPRCQLGCLGF